MDPWTAREIENIFDSTRCDGDVERLHLEDSQSKWFGVVRDGSGKPILEDYGRYDALCAGSNNKAGRGQPRFPQLVSFIGVTNSGKSAVVNLLISLTEEHHRSNGRFLAPVVGAIANESVPTSDGVSMYSDPTTSDSRHPIMYVDCEGFEGGEKTPLGSRMRRHEPVSDDHEYQLNDSVRVRSIKWATTEESRRREYTVTSLYPRILYTFSDCVVFVLRNPKTFQSSVLTKLIDWGAAALERSINQPVLPHCIVTLNCSDATIDPSQWDSDCATQALLSSVRGAINLTEGVPRFRALADHWRKLGRDICSVEDLILCYYSSFRVVRLPTSSHFNRMQEQIAQLRRTIRQCCYRSSEAKRRTRMQSDAVELGTYLQSGLDHFTSQLDLPFDFMQVSLAQNPIPHSFGDHILQLCLAIQRLCLGKQDETRRLLERVGTFVASCVLLDCAHYRKGRLETLSIPYEQFFERAVGEYLALHVRCAYSSPNGARRCNMIQARHDVKGHQDMRGVIASGEFVAPFGVAFANQWTRQHKEAMSQLEIDFCYRRENTSLAMSDRQIAWELHLESVREFYGNLGAPATMVRSHATCLCCLKETPQYALPCGHVLCERCTRAFGRGSEMSLTVDCCPLHRSDIGWEKPARFRLKALEAGACALSLDAGGIRGIVQLETLRAIGQALGNHVPVQKFFDIIVGAGTGGLIAVSLVAGGRTVDQCLDLFLATCDHAYETDSRSKSLIDKVSRIGIDKRKMRTRGLHGALRDAFTSHRGFFGEADQFSPDIKVALTSTNSIDGRSTVLANYRRPESDGGSRYVFLTTTHPEAGPRTFQAVAATMADAASFKSVRIGDRKFVDDGARDVRPWDVASDEVRRIWPAAHSSMVCLSLGTGQDWKSVSTSLLVESVRCSGGASNPVPDATRPWPRPRFFTRRWVTDRNKVLTAEREWQRFRLMTSQLQPHARGHGLLRLNPDLGVDREPPHEHDYASMRRLQASVRDALSKPKEREVVKRTANRLVATSFYFHTDERIAFEKDMHVIRGRIACQFEEDANVIKGLGRILRDQFRQTFEPYFEIRPVADSAHVSSRVSLTADKVSRMVDYGIFERLTIRLCLDRSMTTPSSIQLFFAPSSGNVAHGYPLSGLPRVLNNRQSSVVQPYSPSTPTSCASHTLQKPSSKGTVSKPTLFKRLSRHSSRSQGGNDSYSGDNHASTSLAHWLSDESVSTRSSTRYANLDRADSHPFRSPNSQTEVAREDFAMCPLGLTVQGSSQILKGEDASNREHSVLLPPPATWSERPLTPETHVPAYFRDNVRTAALPHGDVTHNSLNSSVTTASPSETDMDQSTWTSFSHDGQSNSPDSGESKVCIHLSSNKA